MASAPPRDFLLNSKVQDSEATSREELHRLPPPQGPKIPPRPPVHGHDSQAVLQRRVHRREPSLKHRETLKRLIFPGWDTQSPPAIQIQQQQRPAHLPQLPSTIKALRSQRARKYLRQTPPGKGTRRLDNSSKVQSHEFKKNDYWIFSDGGMIIYYDNYADYITAEDLDKEQRLRSIPFFAKYPMWRAFTIWRNNVCALKISRAKKFLQKNLFIFSESLGPGLKEIWEMCCQISDTGFCHMEENHTYSLHEFQSKQLQECCQVSADFKEFQALIKKVTIQVIRNCWSNVTSVLTQSDEGFIQSRLTCFIHLVDYLVMNTLHSLVVNTETKLLSEVSKRAHQTSRYAMNCNLSQAETDSAKGEVEGKCFRSKTLGAQPMFITELMLDIDGLTYKPSEEDFLDTVSEITGLFEDTLTSVNILLADPECIAEVRLSSEQEILQFAFNTAKEYSHTLAHFWVLYKENESLDLDALQQQDHGLSFFERALKTYNSGHDEASAIQQEKYLGLLLVNQAKFREKLVFSPLRCLEVVNKMLVKSAKSKLDAISPEVLEAEFKLQSKPSTTAEFADYLTISNQITERIMILKEEQETLSQMYNLINMYSVPMPYDHVAEFGVLKSSMKSLHNIHCRAFLDRDSIMDKFCKSLQKDVKRLNHRVMETQLKSQNPQLLDINADRSRVRLLLGEIQILIDELQDQASTHTSYQKLFQLQLTKLYGLDELISEFSLKQLLWECLEEWDTLQDRCKQSTLQHLDLEDLSTQVNKYSECVSQLEKGLPRNSVVASLKNKVEVTKQRLPVITGLRNPCMKPEHWKTLESVVGTSLNVEGLTLASMEEMGFFTHSMEILAVTQMSLTFGGVSEGGQVLKGDYGKGREDAQRNKSSH